MTSENTIHPKMAIMVPIASVPAVRDDTRLSSADVLARTWGDTEVGESSVENIETHAGNKHTGS